MFKQSDNFVGVIGPKGASLKTEHLKSLSRAKVHQRTWIPTLKEGCM